MGGANSGNWCRWNSKSTTSSCLEICVSRMVRWGWIEENITVTNGSLTWSQRGEECGNINFDVNTVQSPPTMTLRYSTSERGSGERVDMNYSVTLTTTTPHYGGIRWWFICPAKGCGKRVGKLYGGSIFACRTCHNLSYPSQNQSPPFRLLDQAQNIHRSLEKDMDWWGCIPPKPKGMHQKTFQRKVAKMKRLSRAANSAMMQHYSNDPQTMQLAQDVFYDLDD
jgi:hypothetical protein